MDKKEPIEIIARQPAEDTFSVLPLQREVDKQLGSSDRRLFTLSDLKRFSKMARSALDEADTDDPYTTEVLVAGMQDGDYVYDMQVEPPQRLELSGKVLYGFVNGFMVTVPEGAKQEIFAAAFESYSSDITGETHSYLVPMAVKGTNYGVRLTDAPVPVSQNRVEVSTIDMHNIDQEDTEQDKIHALLNIIETDLFDEDATTTDILEESIKSLQDAGFIEKLDDMVTACNYYFQACLHDFEPWIVNPNGIMEQLNNAATPNSLGGKSSSLQWVSEELSVVGIDLSQGEKGVKSTLYAYSEEGYLYRSSTEYNYTLFREEARENYEAEDE